MTMDLSLYLVTDSRLAAQAGRELTEVVQAAVAHGVTAVQVREKNANVRDFLTTVTRVAEVIPSDVRLIVNDRVDVFLAARAAGAHVSGVHIGQSDLPASLVRALIGPEAILGISAATQEELDRAASGPARVDYVGIGALHATTTKWDAPAPLGHAGLAHLMEGTALPAVVIGGVTKADLNAIRNAGAAGAAVVSALCSADDVALAARELREAWDAAA